MDPRCSFQFLCNISQLLPWGVWVPSRQARQEVPSECLLTIPWSPVSLSTMKMRILFVTAFMLSAAVSMKSHAYFNRTAYLPCPFTQDKKNLSLSELVVFWQDKENLVLYEHYLGRKKLDNVNAKYRGRTSFDGDNWTLQLHGVQIKDMGSYVCFIQEKTPIGSFILQQTDTELSVTANFSEPEIEEIQNITRNSGINLTCSSKQGYPKPTKIYFLITNSTDELGDDMRISQDNVTKLFSISINLFIPFPDDMYNVTAMCVLETESMRIFSRSYDIVPPEVQPVAKEWKEWITAVLAVLGIGLVLALLVKRCLRKQKQPGIS